MNLDRVQLTCAFRIFPRPPGLFIIICCHRARSYSYNFLWITTVSIDIVTKIVKQKCFGCKTYFPDTFFNSEPRNLQHFCVYSEFNSPEAVGPLFLWVFRKFTCSLGFAGRRRRRTTTNGRDGRTGDDDDGRTDGTDGQRTTTTDGRTQLKISNTTLAIIFSTIP